MQSGVTRNTQSKQGDGAPSENPFKFIEQALTEAKGKIAKMQQTPQILESLPDVRISSNLLLCNRMKKRRSTSRLRTSCSGRI
jgi:hypothetical protein